MAINRYVSPSVSIYNPLSMDELAFAPAFLRQRHDVAAEQLSELGIQAGQYDVLNDYQNVAGQLVDPLQRGIDELATNLATQGVNRSNAVPQALKLKSQYSTLFGQNGAIGQLENATKQYRAQAQQIQEFFKENPELARGAMQELRAGEATVGSNGKLNIGQISSPNYVRHYDAKEINDLLNTQIGNIKDSTLKSFGFSNTGSISSVQDVYRQGQIDGISQEDVTKILMSQLSPEVIQSARQYGKYALGNEEAGLMSLQSQIQGAAMGRANQTLKDSYSVITNADKEAAAKGAAEQSAQQSFWDYDPVTQEISPLGIDESYFEIPTREGFDSSSGFVSQGTSARHGVGGTPIVTDKYKEFSPEQKLEAFEVLSSLTGKPISEIPESYLDSKDARDRLKKYYNENKGKIQVQPTIDNTDYLKEYGNKPENATADVMANYQSRPIFDVNAGKQLTPEEFEEYMSDGKMSVIGAYSAENPFGYMANNVQPEYMANPLAVVLRDDNGKILKRFAVARDPGYVNTQSGIEAVQYNSIYNSTVKTPNVDKLQTFTFVNKDNQPIAQVPMKVKYNTNDKSFTVSSVDGSFKTFKTAKTTNIAQGIINNRNK